MHCIWLVVELPAAIVVAMWYSRRRVVPAVASVVPGWPVVVAGRAAVTRGVAVVSVVPGPRMLAVASRRGPLLVVARALLRPLAALLMLTPLLRAVPALPMLLVVPGVLARPGAMVAVAISVSVGGCTCRQCQHGEQYGHDRYEQGGPRCALHRCSLAFAVRA